MQKLLVAVFTRIEFDKKCYRKFLPVPSKQLQTIVTLEKLLKFHIVLVITGPSQGKLGRNAAECLLTLASLVIPNLSISLFTLLHYILCSVAPTLHGNSLQIWEAGAGATIANSSLF